MPRLRREVARGVTDADGRLRRSIPTRLLGHPGAGLLRIESLRDERRAEAQTEARVVRRRAVKVRIEPKGDYFEAGGALSVRGDVRTRVAPRVGVPVGLFAGRHYADLLAGRVLVTGDSLVFAIAFAAVGSALPDEMLFRGYLQGALDTRTSRWVRLAVPALAFASLRGLRHLPGQDLTVEEWLRHLLGVAIPLGLWWGFMRDLARGSLWPTFISNLLLEFGRVLAGAPPVPLIPRG